MAYFDQNFTTARPGIFARVARLFETPFDRRSRQLAAEVAALRDLTDAELARRGIARDQILYHVFQTKRR